MVAHNLYDCWVWLGSAGLVINQGSDPKSPSAALSCDRLPAVLVICWLRPRYKGLGFIRTGPEVQGFKLKLFPLSYTLGVCTGDFLRIVPLLGGAKENRPAQLAWLSQQQHLALSSCVYKNVISGGLTPKWRAGYPVSPCWGQGGRYISACKQTGLWAHYTLS